MLQNLYAYRALRGGVWERTRQQASKAVKSLKRKGRCVFAAPLKIAA